MAPPTHRVDLAVTARPVASAVRAMAKQAQAGQADKAEQVGVVAGDPAVTAVHPSHWFASARRCSLAPAARSKYRRDRLVDSAVWALTEMRERRLLMS